MMLQANGSQKKVGGASHITDKIHFKTKMQQENILFIINIYAPNIKALKYKKQILTDLKRENDSSTVIRGDLNTIFRSVDGISRQKVNKVT